MQFEFITSHQIIFGQGALTKLYSTAPSFGKRALLVSGSGSVALDPVLDILDSVQIKADLFRVNEEPDIPSVEAGIRLGKETGCDFVIGFGGGSAIDAAKTIAAMLSNPGDLMDYLEVIGGEKEIPNPSLPMIAVPTTAGTGTEVTRNAVISSPDAHVKVSMRSIKMIPRIAIVDPELTYSMPAAVTASTGMDALTQVIEAYVTKNTNPMIDAIAKSGIERGGRSLLTAYQNGNDISAREDMALTSLFGGLALANAGLGAVHGFAGPIGGMYRAPHGAICACLLPAVMKHNVISLDREPDGGSIKNRYEEIARLLTGMKDASIWDGVKWIAELSKQLNIPGLRDLGIAVTDFEEIIAKSRASSSMQKNPVKLSDSEMLAILEESY